MKPDLYAAIKNLEEVNRMISKEENSMLDLKQLAFVLIDYIDKNKLDIGYVLALKESAKEKLEEIENVLHSHENETSRTWLAEQAASVMQNMEDIIKESRGVF